MYTRYTDEQTKRAGEADLVALLQHHGQQVKRVGSEYEWYDGNQTVSIKGNLWFHQYERVGGNTIDFVKKFFGLNFPDAVKLILDEEGAEDVSITEIKRREETVRIKPEPKAFVLPNRNGNMRRVFGYLITTRGIDREVIRTFAHNKLLYESTEHHNVVFVGCDPYGTPVHAQMRSAASNSKWRGNQAGSDARYSFNWRGPGSKVFVFEAPIDMLSYISMHPENWSDFNYIAACSLSEQPLIQMLQDNPNLRHICICYDNDPPGQKAAQELCAKLSESGYDVEILVPSLKDWNEDLLSSVQEVGEVECQTVSQLL